MRLCQVVLLVDSFSTVVNRDCNGYLPDIYDANGLGPQRPGILPRALTLATMLANGHDHLFGYSYFAT